MLCSLEVEIERGWQIDRFGSSSLCSVLLLLERREVDVDVDVMCSYRANDMSGILRGKRIIGPNAKAKAVVNSEAYPRWATRTSKGDIEILCISQRPGLKVMTSQ